MRAAALAAPVIAAPPAVAWRVGAANDAAEAEADAAAARVLGAPVLRRKCEECDREAKLSRRADGGAVAPDAAGAVDAALAEGGGPLAAGDARFFSDGLSADLSGVRVHTGAAADRAARSVGARAFALGGHVVFAEGQYRPEGGEGRRLLAHELAHVAQQSGAPVLRRQAPAPAGAMPGAGPTGVLPALGAVCGPDVTAATSAVWQRVQTDFAGWADAQKCEACSRLVNPVIAGSGKVDTSQIGAGLTHAVETGNVVEGGQGVLMGLGGDLNRDAFDTLGLYLASAAYLREPPYSPDCGKKGSPDPTAPVTDHVHESPGTCATTVQIGAECWVSGTANYGTYGVMMRACHDWIDGGGACSLPAALFSRNATIALVQAYKRLDRDDPEPPTRWATATYDGGPSAQASGGNRWFCPTTCAVPYSGGPFSYVWQPVMPRVGWSP